MIGPGVRNLVLAVAIWAATHHGHAATQCEVDVYRAYSIAVSRGWKFECDNATFVPLAVTRQLSCQGKTGAIARHKITIKFFGHGQSSQGLKEGWRVATAVFDGVSVKKITEHPFQVAAVAFTTRPYHEFRVTLNKLKLEKIGGNCADVYQQAF